MVLVRQRRVESASLGALIHVIYMEMIGDDAFSLVCFVLCLLGGFLGGRARFDMLINVYSLIKRTYGMLCSAKG